MRERRLSYLVSILVLSFCINANSNDYKLLDRIIVSIEKDVVTQSELDKELANVVKNFEQSNLSQSELNEISKEVLDRLIEKKLITQYAESIGLKITSEELDLVINNILKNNNISEETLKQELLRDGSSIAEFRENLSNQLIVQKIKDREIMPYVNISDYEINAYLKKKQKDLAAEFKVSHILIKKTNPNKDKILNQVIKKIKSEDFGNVALEFSEGPNALEKGDLGWNTVQTLPSIFINFVSTAQKGDISNVIESPNGYHLIKIESIRNSSKEETILVRQYKFQQILLKKNAITTDEDLEKKLTNYKNLISNGLDFSEAVKLYSDDQFSIDSKNLQWINFNDLIPDFRNKLSVYPSQTLIGPFKTDLGWHLVKIYDFQEADVTNQTEREKVKIELAREKTEIRFKDWLNALLRNSNIKYFDDN